MTAQAGEWTDLDLYFGPEREIQSIYETKDGRWYANLVCGHKVRTIYMSESDMGYRRKFGHPPKERCHVCKRQREKLG